MKTFYLYLFLIYSLNAQTIWYVDKDATGNGNGSSWTNASKTLRGLPWRTLLAGGDTVYISGGEYPGEGPAGGDLNLGAFSSLVVVAPAWQAGHTGEVRFRNTDTGTRNFSISNSSNIKFINLVFENAVSSYGSQSLHNITVQYSSDIIFDGCTVITNGYGGTIYFGTCDRITFTNGIVSVRSYDNPYDSDPIAMSGGRGGHTITNNKIYDYITSTNGSNHRDIMQFPGLGMGYNDNLQTTIAGNILWYPIDAATTLVGGLYCTGSGTQRYLIYNNIIMFNSDDGGSPIVFDYIESQYSVSIRIFNNTFISHHPSIITAGPDTVVWKNNICLKEDAGGNYTLRLGSNATEYNNSIKNIDYNFYYSQLGFSQNSNTINHTWNQWQSAGYDIHGDTIITVPALLSVTDSTITSYYTSFGRDLGTDLSGLIPAYDILGNPRNDGYWDAGALEYQGTQSNDINVYSKIFLQGPFNTNSMNTSLSQNSLLPNTQPFNTSPWNYNGNESLGSSSSLSYVDWVLVELRSSSNPTQVVSRKAAILKNDGTLLNSDGSAGVPFSNVQEGSYYVAVFHRNHLAVMSANPVQLSANSQIYDFTNGLDKAYGTNPMANLGNGIFGMYTGDGNSNGGITIADRNEVWLPQNGTLGYLHGDFNLDGGVTIHDVNLYWNINNGTMTQVP